MEFKVKPCGECSLSIQFENKIDTKINEVVIALSNQMIHEGIETCIPAYCALTVVYNPLIVDYDELLAFISDQIQNLPVSKDGSKEIVEIPVCYDGPDLEYVAEHTGLTREAVIAKHSKPLYRVFMLGFTPGFPYLGGMDSQLETPRLENPRTKIEAGSVGIAGKQTGIYPLGSPGGWQLIGKTDVKLFDISQENPFLLSPGMYIRFVPVDKGGNHGN